MDEGNSDKNKTIEKEIQTESELQQHCMCKEIVEQNKLVLTENSIICIFKKNDLDEEEWDDIENTVKESEVDLDDMLLQWSKVIKGYSRINEKKRRSTNKLKK